MADPGNATDLLEYASGISDDATVPGRAESLVGTARGGLVSSLVQPLAGANRLLGQTDVADQLAAINKEQQAPGGLFPTNPAYDKEFLTGVARGVGQAPMTLLEAAGGLPGLVGTGAVSGYEAYKEAKADYDARAASGQLAPGEQPPNPYKEIAKGAAGNAAFLAGGGAAGMLAKRALPAIEGPLARAATAYGSTVAGNLAGSAAARTIETGSPAYESPAAAGEDIFTGGVTFGPGPARHLLAAPQAKYGYVAPPRPGGPAPAGPVHPVDEFPALSLNPISDGSAGAKPAAPPPQPPAPTFLTVPDAIRWLEMSGLQAEGFEPVKVGNATHYRPTGLSSLAENAKAAQVSPQPPATTLPTDETRNETQLGGQVGPSNGPGGPVDQTGNAGQPLRIERGVGPGAQEGPLLEPDVNLPGGEAPNAQPGLRGQGELGGGPAQRPVLAPVPESTQTLQAQQDQLVAGRKPAVLFTPGEARLPAPPGMAEVEGPSGLWQFDPKRFAARDIVEADKGGRQNQLLGLGPENKEEAQAAPGKATVVTERAPDGTEVKAAVASEGQAPATAAELETQKTPGNTVQEEAPEQVLAARRNQATVENLHAQIGALDEQLAQARRLAVGPDGKPLPGPEAAAARDALPDLTSKREDLSAELMNFTPESEAANEPMTARQQAHADTAADLGSLLENAKQKLAAQNAVVDSMRPENARKGVDENGNTVEDLGGLSKEDRDAFNEAKAEAASLRKGVNFLEQKLREHERLEPPQVIGAPKQSEEETAKRMADRYKAEPAKVQAFVANAEAKVLPKFEAQVRQIFGDGVTIVRNSDRTPTIGVVPTRDGGVEIHLGPDYLARTGAKFGEQGGAHLGKTLGEEGIHVAVLRAIKEMWQKAGSPGDFYVFTKGVMSRVSNDILNTVKGLRDQGKHSEAHAIEEAIRNSKELYDGELENSNSLTGRQILEQMAQDPATAFKYANELLRQFSQLRQNKQISETTYQKITRALTQLYRAAQQSLRNVVGKAFTGELGQTAGEILRRTEELIKGQKPESKAVTELRPEPARTRAAVSHVEDSVIPWHGGADDKKSRTISRDTPGYSPGQAAADFLADSHGPGADTLRPDQRNTVDLAKLAQFESGRGRLIDRGALLDGNPNVLGGGEHQVLFDPVSQRWLKFTRPGQSGLVTEKFKSDFPLPADIHAVATRNATPSEYLDRMRLANEKFGDDWQYHGVWLDKAGEPGGIVTSQPHIEGADAHQLDITRQMKADGFKRIGTETWYRPSDRLMVDDAAPRNFVVKNGVTQPIDVPLTVANDELHNEAMKVIASGKTFEKPAERALPFGNRRLEEPALIGAPRFIEKAAKTIEEKTREARFLWSKSYRGFKDSFFRANDVIDTTGNNAGAKVQDRIYVTLSKAGGGKHENVAEPSKGLKEAAEVAFPLREAGFGDATSREEIDASKAKLEEFIQRIDQGLQSADPDVKSAAEALKPIYGKALDLVNTDLGQALARALTVAQETNRQLADAAANGIDIEGVDNYIRRVYAQDLSKDPDSYIPSAGGRGGPRYDKGFLKPRAFESAVEAMESGKKVANFDVAQLVGQGEASLQKLIGEKRLGDELHSVAAPVTGKPVITAPLKVWNGRLREFVDHAPDGYVQVEGPGGKKIFVEQNVAPLFRTLAAPSWVRGIAPGRFALKVAAGIKHGTLLFDSYHLARQTANLLGLLGQNASADEIRRFIKRGIATLDVDTSSLDHYVKEGHLTEADKQYVLDNQAKYKIAEEAGVNFGKQLDNLYEQIGKPFWVNLLNQIPRGKAGAGGLGDYITDFNKYVFQKSARSAMLVGFNEAYERNLKRFPNATPEEVARQSAKEINETFGNMGRQGIFKSKTAQDISRLFVLAPQWNDARLRFQGRAVGQLARAVGKPFRRETTTRTDAAGNVITESHWTPEALGNAGGTLLALAAGAFTANQVLNLATRGQPTWQNEDGHKLDAWIPGGKNGFFYSPLNLAAEDIHTAMKYGEKGTPLEAAKRIALNKGSGITKAVAALGGIDPLGRPLPGDVNRLAQAGKSLLPIPIFASPLTSPVLQPELAQKGDLQRQGLGMLGIKLDRAESPEQRLRTLANQTQPSQFPKVGSPGDYSRLRSFVSNEKLGNAKEEILGLIAKGKTEDQIRKAFVPTRTFTTSKQSDVLLMRQPAARELLGPARQSRVADANFVSRAIAEAKQDPRYVEAVMKARTAKLTTP